MANPLEKSIKRNALLRQAVAEAATQAKVHVMMDARPCSIEIGRNAKGELTYNIKIYTIDAQETFDTVKEIRKIEQEIKDKFNI